jgi:7,8-dihydropterin-6-yl-methyl-4-(beta-D-ribofuranosyl)aminobenzene 5'-phosphate synthase
MGFRAAPWTWPLLTVASPILAPVVAVKNIRFRRNQERAERENRARLERAGPLDLPELESIELSVISEQRTKEGFLGEAGVSYLLRTEQGSLLFDVGWGADHDVMSRNAAQLGITLDDADALVISHLHADHIGGMKAMRARRVKVVESMGRPGGQPCYLPDQAEAEGFAPEVVSGPQLLAAGIATTGPLARSLFFFGWTEEQVLLARLRGKGLVVITGCGHPTVPVMLKMVSRLSGEPIHAMVGGLHFPVTGGHGRMLGLDVQTFLGTGKPPWRRITDADLTEAIAAVKEAAPARLLLSAHDTCDHALKRFEEVDADVEVLRAGETYSL